MKRTKAQSDRFHGLVFKLKLDKDEKKEIVSQVSKGRETSSANLTEAEMLEAIEILSGNDISRTKRMQAKARAVASNIGLITIKNGVSDYTALNTFILKKFKVDNLFKLDDTDLRNCITALENWRSGITKKFVKSAIFESENE